MIVHHPVGIALAAYDKVWMSCATGVQISPLTQFQSALCMTTALRILKGVDPETAPFLMIVHYAVGIALAAYDKVWVSRSARVLTDRVVAQIH